jgi:hypothetical protein
MAAESLLSSISWDWRRVESDVRTLDSGVFCADWWRGLDVKLSLEAFGEEWARGASPVFCRVQGEDLGPSPVSGFRLTKNTNTSFLCPLFPCCCSAGVGMMSCFGVIHLKKKKKKKRMRVGHPVALPPA